LACHLVVYKKLTAILMRNWECSGLTWCFLQVDELYFYWVSAYYSWVAE
jgi:hypothetical protein